MFSLPLRKRHTQHRICLYLEELERRCLLSSTQPAPIWDTVYSTNWSGYAAETDLGAPASDAVTMVSGSWTVPTVSGKANAYSSVWVGIDGYASNSVEQLGTEQDTSKSGATRYYAWWEMYPNPSVRITSMTIHPGDSISASVTYNAGAYTLQITDNTTGQSFSTVQAGTAQRSSAEWIVEAPSSFSGILPLANFGTATFSGAQATINGITGPIDNLTWQNTAIDMVNASGTVIDHTGALTDTITPPITSSFSVTFIGSGGGGHGHGHGHGHELNQAVMSVVPGQLDLQAPVTLADMPSHTVAQPATAAAQDLVHAAPLLSAPVADAFFAQVSEHASTSAVKTWLDDSQPESTDGALDSDVLAADEFQSL